MYKITDAAGFKIYATFRTAYKARMYAKDHGLRVVKVAFSNDHNSLFH